MIKTVTTLTVSYDDWLSVAELLDFIRNLPSDTKILSHPEDNVRELEYDSEKKELIIR